MESSGLSEQLEPLAKRIKLEVGDNIRDFYINWGTRNSEDTIHNSQDSSTKTEFFDDRLLCSTDDLQPLDIDEVEEFIRALQEADATVSRQQQINSVEGPGGLQTRDLKQYTLETSHQTTEQFAEPFAPPKSTDTCHFNWSTFSLKPKVSAPTPKKKGRKRKQPLDDSIISSPSPSAKSNRRTNQNLQNINDPVPSEVLECPQCPRHFETMKQLKRHLKRHKERNQESAPKFKCNFCPRSYQSKTALCQHQQVHTGECPFECPHCTKCFPTQLCVDDHIRHKHTGERPFACPTCGKRFFSSANLWQHSRLHTGLMLYGCEKCGKRFRQSSGLTGHIRKFRGNCVSES